MNLRNAADALIAEVMTRRSPSSQPLTEVFWVPASQSYQAFCSAPTLEQSFPVVVRRGVKKPRTVSALPRARGVLWISPGVRAVTPIPSYDTSRAHYRDRCDLGPACVRAFTELP